MFLDRPNLHTARQVSKEFNSVIKEQVLGTREGRKSLMRTSLQNQWRSATPARSGVTIGGLTVKIGISELKLTSENHPGILEY